MLRALGFSEDVVKASDNQLRIKKSVTMSNPDSRKVTITLWEDDTVTIIGNSKSSEPLLSSADSPEQFHIAKKFYIDQGLIEE